VGVSRDCPIFWLHPIISEITATNCKFGRYIHRVYPNKSPLKIWDQREHGRIQGVPKFFEWPLLYQLRVKLRTANMADTFKGSNWVHPKKSAWNIWQKRDRGCIQGCPIFSVPLIISGTCTCKATNFKFCTHIHRINQNKSPLKFREK